MESYNTIRARHQAEVNAFPLGFAFNKEQFAEMMEKFGLPNDADGCRQIVSLPFGGFLKKADIPAWRELCKRHDEEMKEMRRDRKELTEAFRYEFANHECQYGMQNEEVCNAVGLTWDEVQNDAELLKIFQSAYKLFWKDCVKNDWF